MLVKSKQSETVGSIKYNNAIQKTLSQLSKFIALKIIIGKFKSFSDWQKSNFIIMVQVKLYIDTINKKIEVIGNQKVKDVIEFLKKVAEDWEEYEIIQPVSETKITTYPVYPLNPIWQPPIIGDVWCGTCKS